MRLFQIRGFTSVASASWYAVLKFLSSCVNTPLTSTFLSSEHAGPHRTQKQTHSVILSESL